MSTSSSFSRSLSEERPVAVLWGTELHALGCFGGTCRQEWLWGGQWLCPAAPGVGVHEGCFPLSHGVCSQESIPFAFEVCCQLNTGTRTCVVKEDDDLLEHLVLLKTICLGAEARDELHVVAVDSKNTYGDHKPVPIAALRTSVLPMISLKGLELVPPITFMLKCGAGPVYLSGQHITRESCCHLLSCPCLPAASGGSLSYYAPRNALFFLLLQ
uniref:Nucleoplasmin core domain-containing protein n=1 Tax=Buteo japonicus TaxID=224669 RepID=A0A8C0ASA9_9AVES